MYWQMYPTLHRSTIPEVWSILFRERFHVCVLGIQCLRWGLLGEGEEEGTLSSCMCLCQYLAETPDKLDKLTGVVCGFSKQFVT